MHPVGVTVGICHAMDRRNKGSRSLLGYSFAWMEAMEAGLVWPSLPSYTAVISHTQSTTRSSVMSNSCRKHLKPMG